MPFGKIAGALLDKSTDPGHLLLTDGVPRLTWDAVHIPRSVLMVTGGGLVIERDGPRISVAICCITDVRFVPVVRNAAPTGCVGSKVGLCGSFAICWSVVRVGGALFSGVVNPIA